MNASLPPPLPTAPAKKSGMPTWAIVAIVLGITGIVGVFMIGMLAAIAIPGFALRTRNTEYTVRKIRPADGASRASIIGPAGYRPSGAVQIDEHARFCARLVGPCIN